jgi:hypothetical protein
MEMCDVFQLAVVIKQNGRMVNQCRTTQQKFRTKVLSRMNEIHADGMMELGEHNDDSMGGGVTTRDSRFNNGTNL